MFFWKGVDTEGVSKRREPWGRAPLFTSNSVRNILKSWVTSITCEQHERQANIAKTLTGLSPAVESSPPRRPQRHPCPHLRPRTEELGGSRLQERTLLELTGLGSADGSRVFAAIGDPAGNFIGLLQR